MTKIQNGRHFDIYAPKMVDFVINDVHLIPTDMFGIIYTRKTQKSKSGK